MYTHSLLIFLTVGSIIIQVNSRILEYKQFRQRLASDFTRAQQIFQQEVLDAHNTIRSHHCVAPLKLDNELSRSAQKFAEYLAEIHQLKHSDDPYLGENIYKRKTSASLQDFSGADPTNYWYSEITAYDFNKPEYSPKTGHFTQVVWKESERMGVGYAVTVEDSQNVVYVVALYSPGGNVDDDFAKNVISAKC